MAGDYRNLDKIYTTQWPFHHFELEERSYISEDAARELFDKMGYFAEVFFEAGRRKLSVLFRTSTVEAVIYSDGEPFYSYSFRIEGEDYKTVRLRSFRIKNISCNLREEGDWAYMTEWLVGTQKRSYVKKYSPELRKALRLDFNEYDELLDRVEGIDAEQWK